MVDDRYPVQTGGAGKAEGGAPSALGGVSAARVESGEEALADIPRPEPESLAIQEQPSATPLEDRLPARLRALLAQVRERGRYTTQEHMAKSGVSHRTALRDLQSLVANGFIERVGVRRGAWYRPDPRLTDSSAT